VGKLTAHVYLVGDALLEFDGDGSITTIDEGASLSLNGPNAFLANTGVAGNSALPRIGNPARWSSMTRRSRRPATRRQHGASSLGVWFEQFVQMIVARVHLRRRLELRKFFVGQFHDVETATDDHFAFHSEST
jgi:hypothetical protein